MKHNIFKKIMVTGLASAMCIGGVSAMDMTYPNSDYVTSAYAATIKDTAFSSTGTIKSNVSMRKGPGTSYTRLSTLRKDTKVTIVAKSSNGWYKIKNGSGSAYIYSSYVTLKSNTDDNTNKDTAYTATGTTTANLSVRKSASTSATKLGTLSKNTKVNIVAKASNGWYKIKYNNGYGYVSNQYVNIKSNTGDDTNKDTAYAATGTTTANLSVRKSASTSATKLGTLSKNTKVTIVAKASNGWYKIKYNNGYAYVSNQYVTINTKPSQQNKYPASAVVNHDVYVRKGAATSYSKLGTLRKNSKITVLSKTNNGWYKVKYGSNYGYAYGQYITVTNSQK